MTKQQEISIRLVTSVDEIGRTQWNQLANPSTSPSENFAYNPFLSFEFFSALEKSGSADRQSGWLGQHLVMESALQTSEKSLDDTPSNNSSNGPRSILGILPCYLKNHSQGEYVFDHGWADAFERAGGHYYPKLQASIPFTPATGRRFLVGNHQDSAKHRLMLAGGLQQVCEQLNVSSAHITFMEEQEWQTLGAHGFLQRTDQQFHWLNDGYRDFDGFLDALSSRKRKNIRKERKAAQTISGLEIEWLSGAQLTEEIWDVFFEFYMDTGSRKWGQPYLTRAFYSLIGEQMADDIVLIMAKRDGRYIAGAINFIGSHTLYGRHWGCIEEHPFLHFEICYYQAIDYAIANRLKRIEAGAQGAHKLARGYLPQITHSAHYITHEGFYHAIENYLEHEREAVQQDNQAIAKHAPFKAPHKEGK